MLALLGVKGIRCKPFFKFPSRVRSENFELLRIEFLYYVEKEFVFFLFAGFKSSSFFKK